MKTKKEYKYFSIFSYEKEQDYLREMHQHGWRFVKVTGFGIYHFEECEPADVIYQLDYNQEGLSHKTEYVQMFNDCGWEYIQDYAGYCYFRKPASEMHGDEEIFCDDTSRLAMMGRVFKGRMIPLAVILTACLLPQFVLQLVSFQNYSLAATFGCIILIYIAVIGGFGLKYLSFKNRIGK